MPTFVSVPVRKRNNCCDIEMVAKPRSESKSDAGGPLRAKAKHGDKEIGYDLVGLAG